MKNLLEKMFESGKRKPDEEITMEGGAPGSGEEKPSEEIIMEGDAPQPDEAK